MALEDVSGTELIAVAKDWASGRKTADQCLELFVRTMQALTVLDSICYLMGETLDGVVELAENARRRKKEEVQP